MQRRRNLFFCHWDNADPIRELVMNATNNQIAVRNAQSAASRHRMTIAGWVGVMSLMLGLLASTPALAAEQSYGLGLGFKQMQKVWRGLTEKPRMTTCRLATRQTFKRKQICVYSGANHTLLAIYNDAGAFCTNEMRCRYDPDRSKSVTGYVRAFRASQK